MAFLLELHSLLRWVIVLVGLVALVIFLLGWARKQKFGKKERRLSAAFSGIMDLQTMLGLIFFFWAGMSGGGFPRHRWEHLSIMLLAAIVAHAPSMFKKAENKFAVAFWAIVGAFLLVILGVFLLPGGWGRQAWLVWF